MRSRKSRNYALDPAPAALSPNPVCSLEMRVALMSGRGLVALCRSPALGIHPTLDLGGQARFGPDVEWVDIIDYYPVDPERARRFYAAIRRYWPALCDGALLPGIPLNSAENDRSRQSDFAIPRPEDTSGPQRLHCSIWHRVFRIDRFTRSVSRGSARRGCLTSLQSCRRQPALSTIKCLQEESDSFARSQRGSFSWQSSSFLWPHLPFGQRP